MATVILGIFLVCAIPGGATAAAGDEGSASGVFLKVDPGARSSAMGSAFVAAPAGPWSSQYNPASLGSVSRSEVGFSHQNMFQGVSYNNLSAVHDVHSLPGGFGLNVKAIDYGSKKRREISGNSPVTGLGTYSADDVSVGLGWGHRVSEDWEIGARINHVQESIAGYSDETISVDVGARIRIYGDQLVLGLAARNLVGELRLNQRSDPLARVYEGGIFYQQQWRTSSLRAGVDYVTSSDADGYVGTGVEWGWHDTFFLRGGFKGAQEAGEGFTFGGGIEHGRFSVDYANVDFGELGRHSKFSLTYRFGAP